MDVNWRDIGRGAGLAAGLLAACGAAWGMLWVELNVRGGTCGENSLVEFAQLGMLLATGILLWAAAGKNASARGGLALAGGLFLTAAARECDAWLDPLAKWAWMVPALGVAAISAVWAWRNRESVVPGLAAVCRTRHFGLLAAGMAVMLGFSRIFGSKAMWMPLLGEGNYRVVKNVAEEGLELLGDALIFVWAVLAVAELARAGRSGEKGAAE